MSYFNFIFLRKEREVRKMLRLGLKRNFYWMVIIIIGLFILINIKTAEASRRAFNLHEVMEKSIVRHRSVEINGKYFDVYINLDKKSIKIWGEAEDWDEKDKVEKYFEQRNPFNCKITYVIDIVS